MEFGQVQASMDSSMELKNKASWGSFKNLLEDASNWRLQRAVGWLLNDPVEATRNSQIARNVSESYTIQSCMGQKWAEWVQ